MNSQIKNNLNVGKSAAWADAPLLVSCVLVAAVELASLLLRAVNSPALSQGPALVLTKILILLPNPGGLPSLLTGSARFRSKIAVWMVGRVGLRSDDDLGRDRYGATSPAGVPRIRSGVRHRRGRALGRAE